MDCNITYLKELFEYLFIYLNVINNFSFRYNYVNIHLKYHCIGDSIFNSHRKLISSTIKSLYIKTFLDSETLKTEGIYHAYKSSLNDLKLFSIIFQFIPT